MTFRRLIAPLTIAVFAVTGGSALAQGALSGQIGTASDPAFPPIDRSAPAATVGARSASPFPSNGAAAIARGFSAGPTIGAGVSSQDCMNQFVPLREEAEKRGKLIKAAGDRHAGPDEACKLITNFAQAEVKMLNYVESHMAKCGIPQQVSEQLKNGHKNTEALQTRVCALAQQRGPAGPFPVGDFDPPFIAQ